MLFQAVMKFLSRLVEFKILVNWGMVHWGGGGGGGGGQYSYIRVLHH